MKANAKGHTHLLFAPAHTRAKIAKEYVLPTLASLRREIQQVTMYIKNRRNSNKFKAFGLYLTLCLTESFVLRNRLLLYTNRYP